MPESGDLHYPRRTADARHDARELSRAWNAASEQAFSSGLHDPEAYHRTTRMVAAMTQDLRERGPGVEVLLDAWPLRGEILDRLAESSDLLTTSGLDLEAVSGAAFAMRYREVLDELTLTDRLAALTQEPQTTGWLVLEESGYRPGDPFVPYRRLEVEPSTGRALLVTTRANDTFTECVHAVEEGRIDLRTGRLEAGRPDAPGQQSYEVGSSEEREALVVRLQGVAGGPPQP